MHIQDQVATTLKKAAWQTAQMSLGAAINNQIPSIPSIDILDLAIKMAAINTGLDVVQGLILLLKQKHHPSKNVISLGIFPLKGNAIFNTDYNQQLILIPSISELFQADLFISLSNTFIACGLPFGSNLPLASAVISASLGSVLLQTFSLTCANIYLRALQSALGNPPTPPGQVDSNNPSTPLVTHNPRDNQSNCFNSSYQFMRDESWGTLILYTFLNMALGVVVMCPMFGAAANILGSAITHTKNTHPVTVNGFAILGGIVPFLALCVGLHPLQSQHNHSSMFKFLSFYCSFSAVAATIGFNIAGSKAIEENPVTLDQAVLTAVIGALVLAVNLYQTRTHATPKTTRLQQQVADSLPDMLVLAEEMNHVGNFFNNISGPLEHTPQDVTTSGGSPLFPAAQSRAPNPSSGDLEQPEQTNQGEPSSPLPKTRIQSTGPAR